MRLVTSPTYDWLLGAARACAKRFIVSSPFVGASLAEVIGTLAPRVRKTLLTRTDLRDFAMGASDLDILCDLASLGTAIRSLPRLHAKVYIIDEKQALITSANATDAGLRRNWECGVSIDESRDVRRVARLVLSGFGSQQAPQLWRGDELRMLRDPVRALRKQLPRLREVPELDPGLLPPIRLSGETRRTLEDALAGWTKLVLLEVLRQRDHVFSLDEVVADCVRVATRRYPRNRHVRPQVRKQLQRLRDLGLVKFLGGGQYCTTVRMS